ncbi:MAG: phosphatase PAP2 family protein [Acidimicrobiaceae bacterium]|nr:phosphatase PAP2 family protein [Acidimicrobiaceae bacterium]
MRAAGAGVGRGVEAFITGIDEAVESWWEDNLRGKPTLDRIMYSLSEAANHSRLWHALGALQAAARRDPRGAQRLSSALFAEAALVNGLIKTAVGRRRPAFEGQRPHSLRQPLTSSFPSGHASAAMVAAALLSRRSRWTPAYYTLAAAVAASRVHVGLHHASDVAAGMALGAALGAVARRIWR